MVHLSKGSVLIGLLLLSFSCSSLGYKPSVGKSKQKETIGKGSSCGNDYGSEVRLPKSVKPIHYDLTLLPDLEQFTFRGEESILVKILEDNVQMISIHQLNLGINEVSFLTFEKGRRF